MAKPSALSQWTTQLEQYRPLSENIHVEAAINTTPSSCLFKSSEKQSKEIMFFAVVPKNTFFWVLTSLFHSGNQRYNLKTNHWMTSKLLKSIPLSEFLFVFVIQCILWHWLENGHKINGWLTRSDGQLSWNKTEKYNHCNYRQRTVGGSHNSVARMFYFSHYTTFQRLKTQVLLTRERQFYTKV